MGLISKLYTFINGTIISSKQFNDNYDTIYDEFNGKIDNANLKSGAGITDDKLDTITTASKVNVTALGATGQAPGDIIYFNGTNYARLGTGAASSVLTITTAGAGIGWA